MAQKRGGNVMDYEQEIRDLKAALLETKWAVAGLGVCIAQTLATCDPKSRIILSSILRNWMGTMEHRQRSDGMEIALMFGRALVDPAFPFSSTPPVN
jgi:hypothetical protein